MKSWRNSIIVFFLLSTSLTAKCLELVEDVAVVEALRGMMDPKNQEWQSVLRDKLKGPFEENLTTHVYNRFVEKLLKKMASDVQENFYFEKIMTRVLQIAREQLAQGLQNRAAEIQATNEIQDPSKRSKEKKKILNQIANEVLESLPFDTIIIEEVSPYVLKHRHEIAGAEQHFDRMLVLMRNVIIRDVMNYTDNKSEQQRLIRKFVIKSAEALSDFIPADIQKYGFHQTGEAYKKQQARILDRTRDAVGLIALRWRNQSPELAAIESQLAGHELDLFREAIPLIYKRSYYQVFDFLSHQPTQDAQKRIIENLVRNIPPLLKAFTSAHSRALSENELDQQAEIFTQIVTSANRGLILPETVQFDQLQRFLDPEELLLYARFLPYYIGSLKRRQTARTGNSEGWESAVSETLPLYESFVIELRASEDLHDLLAATTEGEPRHKGLRFQELSEELFAFHSMEDAQLTVALPGLDRLSPEQRSWLESHFYLLDQWIKERFSKTLQAETSEARNQAMDWWMETLASDLTAERLSPRQRRQTLNRLRRAFLSRFLLLPEEIQNLHPSLQAYRANLNQQEKLVFDQSWPSYFLGLEKNLISTGQSQAKEKFEEEVQGPDLYRIFVETFETFRAGGFSIRDRGQSIADDIADQAARLFLEKGLSDEDRALLNVQRQAQQMITNRLPEALNRNREESQTRPEENFSRPPPPAGIQGSNDRGTNAAENAYKQDVERHPPLSREEQSALLESIIELEHELLAQIQDKEIFVDYLLEKLKKLESHPRFLRQAFVDLKTGEASFSDFELQKLEALRSLIFNYASQENPNLEVSQKFINDLHQLQVTRGFWNGLLRPLVAGEIHSSPATLQKYRENRERLTNSNLRLAFTAFQKSRRSGFEFLDLIQEGNRTLIHAIDLYDPRVGTQLSTYVVDSMVTSLNRFVSEQRALNRGVGLHLSEEARRMEAREAVFYAENGRSPTEEELAEDLGVTVNRVLELRRFQRAASLDAPVRNSETRLGELVQGRNSDDATPYEGSLATDEREKLQAAVMRLTHDKPREVLIQHYGLDGRQPALMREVAANLGYSSHQMGFQLRTRAIAAIKIMFYLDLPNTALSQSEITRLKMEFEFDGHSKKELNRYLKDHQISSASHEAFVSEVLAEAKEAIEVYAP